MAGSPDGGAPNPTSVQQNAPSGNFDMGTFFNNVMKELHKYWHGQEPDQTQQMMNGRSRSEEIDDLYDNWPTHFQNFYGYDPNSLGRTKKNYPNPLRPPMGQADYQSEYKKIYGSKAKSDDMARVLTDRFYNEMRMRPQPKDLTPSTNVMGPGGQ